MLSVRVTAKFISVPKFLLLLYGKVLSLVPLGSICSQHNVHFYLSAGGFKRGVIEVITTKKTLVTNCMSFFKLLSNPPLNCLRRNGRE